MAEQTATKPLASCDVLRRQLSEVVAQGFCLSYEVRQRAEADADEGTLWECGQLERELRAMLDKGRAVLDRYKTLSEREP